MIWSCRSELPSQNRDAHLFHVQRKTQIFMIFNGSSKIGFYMSKIQKCHLETYWASKEVSNMSKIPKCRLETYWANKENIFVLWAHGPWGP